MEVDGKVRARKRFSEGYTGWREESEAVRDSSKGSCDKENVPKISDGICPEKSHNFQGSGQ